MTTEVNIDFFLQAAEHSLIGASPNPEKLSCTILEKLLKMGFKGKIYPLNPGYQEIRGLNAIRLWLR
jgi:acetate---CoA ligase (ADP-forming) subunit alpha